MQGLQKPVIYLVNPNRKGELPFDIDDQIYVEHTDEKTLEKGFNKKIQLILDKVQLISRYESEQKEMIQNKFNSLSDGAKELLKALALEGNLNLRVEEFEKLITRHFNLKTTFQNELREKRFIVDDLISGGSKTLQYRKLNETYMKYLPEILWE